MSKPFQFSMRRMLGTVALLGVAARLVVLFLPLRFDPTVYSALLFLGFFAGGGTAVGGIEGRPFVGVLCGLVLGILIGEIFIWHVSFARE